MYGQVGSQQTNEAIAKQRCYEGQQSMSTRDASLVEAEFESCKKAVAELQSAVHDLLGRITPVCQPGASGGGETAISEGSQIQAAPSLVRSNIMSLRSAIESVTRDISRVNYRIEI